MTNGGYSSLPGACTGASFGTPETHEPFILVSLNAQTDHVDQSLDVMEIKCMRLEFCKREDFPLIRDWLSNIYELCCLNHIPTYKRYPTNPRLSISYLRLGATDPYIHEDDCHNIIQLAIVLEHL
jgi:hypothetical protein